MDADTAIKVFATLQAMAEVNDLRLTKTTSVGLKRTDGDVPEGDPVFKVRVGGRLDSKALAQVRAEVNALGRGLAFDGKYITVE